MQCEKVPILSLPFFAAFTPMLKRRLNAREEGICELR